MTTGRFLILLICLHLFAFFFLIANHFNNDDRLLQQGNGNSFLTSTTHPIDPSLIENQRGFPHPQPYKFINPALALKVLQKLDIFQPIPPKYYGRTANSGPNFAQPFLGLTNDPAYCEKHRINFVKNPSMVFDKMNFVIEHGPSTIIRRLSARALGNDIMPNLGRHLPGKLKDSRFFDLHLDTNMFYSAKPAHRYKYIGRHFGCLAQEYNHIPGHHSINRKDTIAEGAIAYQQKFTDRPQCFNNDKYFPKTWLLYNKESCLDFFEKLNSPKYLTLKKEREIVFIKKIAAGSHRGEGVFPLTSQEEATIRREYRNGILCGQRTTPIIVQNYVHNPLLLEGRKFDFRMYMVIASTNPLMAYYHDGFLRVSLFGYSANSTDKKVLLTNLALNNKIYKDVKNGNSLDGRDEEELKLAQQWSFDRLKDYLLETEVISDPNWLDNYLRPELKRAMIHLVRMSAGSFLKHSSVWEFYGVDFMLDSNLTLWFIEANTDPALDGYSIPMEKFIAKMLKDHFEVAYNVLRSRMKRVIMLINTMIESEQAKVNSEGEVQIENFEAWKKSFEKVSKNKLEPEFELSSDNGYSKILDDNLGWTDTYMGLIEPECL